MNENSLNYHEETINIKELIVELLNHKKSIFTFTMISFFLAFFIAIKSPDIYRSEVLLAPVENATNRMPNSLGAVSTFANLSGINLPSSASSKSLEGIEILKSYNFFQKLMANKEMLIPLFAVEDWHSSSNTLIIDSSIYDTSKKKWKGKYTNLPPSSLMAYMEFKKIYSVTQDKDNGFITLAVEHYSPYIAKEWLDEMVLLINNSIREKDLKKSNNSIIYLNEQMENTNLSNVKETLSLLIADQIKTSMLASSSDEYIFKIIDPPVVSELKIKPNRLLIILMGILAGFFFSISIILTRFFLLTSEN